jgi:hypothetical protein
MKRPLHPLRIVEAMEALNDAMMVLLGTISAVATYLPDQPIEVADAKTRLHEAVAAIRATLWPNKEGETP